MRAARAFIIWLFIGGLVSCGGAACWESEQSRIRGHIHISCAANMNAIGKGMMLYMGGNKDVCPPGLAHLVLDGQGAGLFICPVAQPVGGSVATEQQMYSLLGQGQHAALIQQFPALSDYIYIRGHRFSTSEEVMVFELPANHRQAVVNTLYADGHVASQRPPAELVEALNQTHHILARRRKGQQ